MRRKTIDTRRMASLAMLCGILFVMGMTGIGFIPLPLIKATTMHIPVILGAILLGVGRSAGAEFSFFLAIPTMLGASALKVLKYGLDIMGGEALMPTGTEWGVLAVGCVVSFIVSLLVIKGLMEYVRNHSFKAFGIYRIILGIAVLGYFLITSL